MLKRLLCKRVKDQSGMALPMALMLMVVASLIVVPGLWAAGSMVKVNQQLETSTVGYYAAKAGIENACLKYKNSQTIEDFAINNMDVKLSAPKDPTIETSAPVITYDADGNRITTTSTTTTYYIQSTATVKDTDKEAASIFATVDVNKEAVTRETFVPGENGTPGTDPTPGTPGVSGYPFMYAISTTGGELKVDSNSLVRSSPSDNGSADVFAIGKLVVDGTGSVHGKGYYTTTAEGCGNLWNGCEKTGPISFQTLDETWYLQQAQLGGYWPTGTKPTGWPNMSLPVTSFGSTTYEIDNKTVYLGGAGYTSYINGNLDIKSGGKIILRGVVWVNGFIQTRSSSAISTDSANPSKQYYLLAHGISTSDQHYINIGSNTDITANNNLNLLSDYGTITLNSNLGESYSPALFGIVYAPNGHVKFDSNSWASVGAVLGKSVVLDSNSMVNYNMNLRNNPIDGFKLNVLPTPGTPGTPGTDPTPATYGEPVTINESTSVEIGKISGR